MAIGAIELLGQSITEKFDYLIFDNYLTSVADGRVSDDVVVIDIDEESLITVGQWPWPRYRLAKLIQTIADNSPRAIGLDILLSEPDRTALSNIKEAFKKEFGLDIGFTGVPPGLSDNDRFLGHILSRTKTITALYFYFDYRNEAAHCLGPSVEITGRVDEFDLGTPHGVLCSTDRIHERSSRNGFINAELDSDGKLRRLPLLLRYEDKIYPSLALATFMRAVGADNASVVSDHISPVLVIGPHRIPINKNGEMVLRMNGPGRQHNFISALEILRGDFDPTDLKDKIVFVGSSAAGLNDYYATAFGLSFPGVESHAVVISNILTNNFVKIPTWAPLITILWNIATAVFVFALFFWVSRPIISICGLLGWALLSSLFSYLIFANTSIYLSPAGPLIVVVIFALLFSFLRYALEQKTALSWFQQLSNVQQVTLESMANVAETRDPETGAHIKRTQHYVRAIADRLREKRLHVELLTDHYIDLLFASAPLHDVGKVGVPDNILLKPGKLTDAEFEIMKRHPLFGEEIMRSTASRFDEGTDNFLVLAGEIAGSHHEKWDGTGYPRGLAGEHIPLSGRIMAVADVYDALISRRCYKEPFTHETAKEMLIEGKGTAFDPNVIDAFIDIEDEIIAIAARYVDEEEELAWHDMAS